METHNGVDWLDRVVADCPIFDKVPIRIKDRLLDSPARNLEVLGVNRRIRKRWKNEGVVIHLYAGKNEGYDLTRALKEAGGTLRDCWRSTSFETKVMTCPKTMPCMQHCFALLC